MRNLVIIGNGFDLAHGLKTSYVDFLAWLIWKYNGAYSRLKPNVFFKTNFYFDDITMNMLKIDIDNKKIIDEFLESKKETIFHNKFLETVLSNYKQHENWCDFEKLYFKYLKGYKDNRELAKQLNDDLFEIKKELIIYLKEQEKNMVTLNAYSMLFNHISNKDIILNFNYTNTVQRYLRSNGNYNLIHIHGNINASFDKIIFGYAAKHKEKMDLSRLDNHEEYLKNIKPFLYNLDLNERKLLDLLEIKQDINVLILGHSCGESDKLILNQIFTNPKVKNIKTCYYQSEKDFFQQQVNIYKIMDNETCFSKLYPITYSSKMPQKEINANIENEFKKNIQGYIISTSKSGEPVIYG